MLNVIKHNIDNDRLWDDFVLNHSINGTFLQSRNFLNYHQAGKFLDCSVKVSKNVTDIYAMIPACELSDNGKKVFISHLGSTFGGPIITINHYNLKDVSLILDSFDMYCKEQGFSKTILKITPDIFASENTDLLQYLLTQRGYSQYSELSSFIDFTLYSPDICSNFTYARRKQQKKCEKEGMIFSLISSDEDVFQFYEILTENLAKFAVKPIHTIDELLEFKNQRLIDIVSFYKVMLGDMMVSGSMSFNFKNTKTLHIQYSGAKQNLGTLSPMTFLFSGLIKHARNMGMSKLSWGISTENKGKHLNLSLAETKESYGSKFALNRTFVKEYY